MNLGLSGSPQEPQTPKSSLPPGPPATLNELRAVIGLVDSKLRETNSMGGRMHFSRKEVINLLLDIRSVLDRLTSPLTLIAIAQQISAENRALLESLGE